MPCGPKVYAGACDPFSKDLVKKNHKAIKIALKFMMFIKFTSKILIFLLSKSNNFVLGICLCGGGFENDRSACGACGVSEGAGSFERGKVS